MKKSKVFIHLMLMVPFILSFSGCATLDHAQHGRVEVTPLKNGEYEIYSAGGIVSDRAAIYKNWDDAAAKTCNGKYKITKEQTTGTSPGGSSTVEGRIRCE